MPPADNSHTAQPTVAPDGKKPSFPKRLLDRFKSRERSSAAGAPATRSMENLPVLDVKPSAFKRLSGAFKSTKSGIAPSTVENLAAPSVSAAHRTANIPDPAAAPMAAEGAAGAQVATSTHTSSFAFAHRVFTFVSVSAVNVDQERSMTPAPAGPTLVMDEGQHSSTAPVPDDVVSANNSGKYSHPLHLLSSISTALNTVSLTNVNQTAQPGSNVLQAQSKFKDGINVALDGLFIALRIAKEASEWKPFLKAALGGAVAVVELAMTVSSNSQDMKDTLDHIQGLLPILKTSAKRLEDRKDGFDEGSLMTFA
ncbi:hypothetical protein H0H87_000317, partial [Tephrocybe sp. NHM501043]